MDLPDKTQQPAPKKKQVKRIVPAGAAKQASRPASKRFFDFVFAESPKALGKRVVEGTIVPRLKAAGEEAVTSFLHGMLWGGGSPPPSQLVQGAILRGGGVNYNALSTGVQMPANGLPGMAPQSSGPYKDVVVPTEQFAQAVLAYMYDLFNDYRVVTVGDLYEAAGISSDTQHEGLGWYSLEGSKITKERDGYRIALPRPTTIRN